MREEGIDDAWVDVVKTGLVGFGEYVASDDRGMFEGLRATRRMQRRARALADVAVREQLRRERERLKEVKMGKGGGGGGGGGGGKGHDREKGEAVVPGAGVSASMTQIEATLKEIHVLTSSGSTSRSTASPKHLFITVSPPPPPDTPPDAENEFDVIPASRTCTFGADTFSFPFYDGGRQGEGGVVIYGLDNWLRE